MKKILVSAGAGFIGYHLARELLARSNCEITIIDNVSDGRMDSALRKLLEDDNVRFIRTDMSGADFYDKLDKRYDYVYHISEESLYKDSNIGGEALSVSLQATNNMLEWITAENCGKFILASHSETCDATEGKYAKISCGEKSADLKKTDSQTGKSNGISKLSGEVLTMSRCKKEGIPYSIIRYFDIYGPRMGRSKLIPALFNQILMKESVIEIYGSREFVSFCYISDAVNATILIMDNPGCHEEIINVGNDGEEIQIIDLAAAAVAMTIKDGCHEIKEMSQNNRRRIAPDLSKLNNLTGYKAKISLDEGLMMTYNWYEKELSKISV